ncbi:TPA: hypothetical protein ACH3X1_008194 [Trebouxia sp. C0004]
MLAAALHGQIWTIVLDKSRSKFLQAFPKPPHTGNDFALLLLYTGGLWAKLAREVKADLGVLQRHVPPGYMLIIKASLVQSNISRKHVSVYTIPFTTSVYLLDHKLLHCHPHVSCLASCCM